MEIQMLNIKNLLTFVGIGGILLISLTLFKSCDKKKLGDITNEKLKENERAAIIIDSHSNTITTITGVSGDGHSLRTSVLRGGNSVTPTQPTEDIKRIDGGRDTRISIDKDGKITVTARTIGFINDFGVGVYKTPSDTRIFIDDQIFFYKRHGFNLGIGRSIADVGNQTEMQKYQLHAAYSYRLPFSKFSNTFFIAGMDTKKEILIGLRVNF
jgi:hypothetical protein